MSKLSPAVHILAVTREQLTESLVDEGHGSDCISRMDALALQFWRHETLDTVFMEVKRVLPRSNYIRVLAFASREYELLYTALPADVKDIAYPEHGAVRGPSY